MCIFSQTSFERSTCRDQRSPFSWDEEVLDQTVKDILVDRAIKTLRHYWSETGGQR